MSDFEETLLQPDEALEQVRRASLPDEPPSVDGYQFETKLGAGSFGEVWGGVRTKTGQRVTVKVLKRSPGETWQAFRHELGRLREVAEHPHIVGLLDADLDHDPPFITMPWLECSLGSAELNSAQKLSSIEQLAEALRYIHSKGILHCDLKPNNVLVDAEARIFLADFGQARLLETEEGSWGTFGWMPPEQTDKEALIDVRWDIYSFGATAYFALSGRLPRLGPEELRSLSSHKSVEQRSTGYRELLAGRELTPLHPRVPNVDQDLSDLIHSCLELDPNHRPASMNEVCQDLVRRGTGEPLLCRRPWSLGYRLTRLLRRPLVLTTLLFLMLGAAGLIYGNATLRAANIKLDQANLELSSLVSRVLSQRGESLLDTESSTARLFWAEALQWASEQATLHQRLMHPPVTLAAFRARVPQENGFFFFEGALCSVISGEQTDKLQVWDLSSDQIFDFSLPGKLECHDLSGRLMVLSTPDDRLLLWDQKRREAVGEPFEGERPALSPDGRMLAYCRQDQWRVVRLEDGALLYDLPYRGRSLWDQQSRTAGLSLDGTRTVKTWQVESGQEATLESSKDLSEIRLEGERAFFWEALNQNFESWANGEMLASYSTDGRYLAEGSPLLIEQTSGVGGTYQIITRNLSGEKLGEFSPSSLGRYSESAAVSLDGKMLALVYGGAVGGLWRVTGEPLEPKVTLDGQGAFGAKSGALFSSDGKRVALWSWQEIRVFDIELPDEFSLGSGLAGLAFFGSDNTLLVWHEGQDKPVDQVFELPSERWSEQQPQIVGVTLGDGRVAIDESSGLTCITSTSFPTRRKLEVVGSTAADQSLTVLKVDHELMIFTPDELVGTLAEEVDALALSRNGGLLATARGHQVKLWNPQDRSEVATIELPQKVRVGQLGFGSQTLAVSWSSPVIDGPGTVSGVNVYGLKSWSLLYQLPYGQAFHYNPDGERLLTHGAGGSAALRDAFSGRDLVRIADFSLALFSPDGRWLSTSFGPSARLYDAFTGDQVRPTQRFSEYVVSMSFSADGTHLAVGDRGGKVRVLDLGLDARLAADHLKQRTEVETGMLLDAQSGVTTPLSPEEWQRLKSTLSKDLARTLGR